jgi:hypothetical protein
VGRAHIHPWYDVVWPVVTGLVTAVGLVAAYRMTGPLMFVVSLAVLELTVAPVAWSLLTDAGYDVLRIVFRVAPASALVLLAVMGLADAIQGWTFLVVALALVTSPLLQGWRQIGLRGVLVDRVSPHAETRRRFDDIVAHGFGPPDDEPPSR